MSVFEGVSITPGPITSITGISLTFTEWLHVFSRKEEYRLSYLQLTPEVIKAAKENYEINMRDFHLKSITGLRRKPVVGGFEV